MRWQRSFPAMGFIELFVDWLFSVMEFDKTMHRKERKERKEKQQKYLCPLCHSMKKHRLSELRTRMTRIGRIFTDTINPCASASSVQSVFHHSFSGMKPTCKKVSAFICVHLRFLKKVIFRTGLTEFTGYVFNPVYPVILSNSRRRLPAPRQSARLLERVE